MNIHDLYQSRRLIGDEIYSLRLEMSTIINEGDDEEYERIISDYELEIMHLKDKIAVLNEQIWALENEEET